MAMEEYEPIRFMDVHKKVDDFIKTHGMTPCDWSSRYDRCRSCKWFDDDGTCDHCGYGWPYYDYNGLKPHEVPEKCDIYVKKEAEMTIEEAKRRLDLARSGRYGKFRRAEMMKVIDQIYDDFEKEMQQTKERTQLLPSAESGVTNDKR